MLFVREKEHPNMEETTRQDWEAVGESLHNFTGVHPT